MILVKKLIMLKKKEEMVTKMEIVRMIFRDILILFKKAYQHLKKK